MATVQMSLWRDVLDHVQQRHPQLVRPWFDQLRPSRLDGGVLEVRAQNHAQVQYLAEHCQRPFAEAAQSATGRLVVAAFRSDDQPEAGSLPTPDFRDGHLQLNRDYVFDNFVTGPCNRLAHAAAVAVAQAPGTAYNPMFIHGATGLGKSHLLQAVCHAVLDRAKPLRILYISCETFINHFMEAVGSGAMNEFHQRYRHVDALLIDDIQFLAERERSQEEFFHTFNTLHQSQRQIVLSADCQPSEIPSLEERLVSRFNSGLVALMDRPCLETRIAIVRNKARLRGIEVPEDIVRLIATHFDSNIRELEGALAKLHALSLTQERPIDAAMAADAFEQGQAVRVAPMEIIDAVTRRFSVRRSELLGRKRSKSIAFPRQVCMYLVRELAALSLEETGSHFGGRDHSTVLHAIRRVEEQRKWDTRLNLTLQELSEQLRRGRRSPTGEA